MRDTTASVLDQDLEPASQSMTISVIIPTKNRPKDLHRTIDTLLVQTRRPDEIVVIDQSCSPCLAEGSLPVPLVYIHAPYLSGLTEARNLAMTRATGDIWLFLDDDVVLEQQYLEQLLLAYTPDVTGVSGIITNYNRPGISRRLFEAVFVKGSFHDDRQPAYWNSQRLRNLGPQRVRQLGGGLMSFRAEAIRDMRFDTNLTGGCLAEDIDFCARLHRGSILLIAPAARLSHERSEIGRTTAHWLDAHAQSSAYMHLKNWNRGLADYLCFAWLRVGYLIIATLGSFKHRSFEPFRAWSQGARRGYTLASQAAQLPARECPRETPA